jgi:transposase-like protein/predicted DNA-binding protein (UPF0251 family)
MTEERIEMSQQERDWLQWLKMARDRKLTQKQAGERMGVTARWVRVLLKRMRRKGDRVVVHALRGQASNRKIEDSVRQRVVEILGGAEWRGYGPTLASEELAAEHGLLASKETVRKWMVEAGLWRARRARVERVQQWRARRACRGELVQWDSSEHDWLEGRGEKLYLVAMIDDATSQALGRLVRHDSTEENLRLLWTYLEKWGRPLEFYTDKASLFQTAPKAVHHREAPEQQPTQIGRALQELGIGWIPAHSPQAKGRIERFFGTAQDRLVKGLRKAGASSLEQANRYLEQVYLPLWNRRFTCPPAGTSEAHRPLGKQQELAAILSRVEDRVITNDYTFQFGRQRYQIQPAAVRRRMRGRRLRVEARLDGTVAACWEGRYLPITPVASSGPLPPRPRRRSSPPPPRPAPAAVNRAWMERFWRRPGPPLWKALEVSNATS